jgi:predicted DNA-binding transcriptional regulator
MKTGEGGINQVNKPVMYFLSSGNPQGLCLSEKKVYDYLQSNNPIDKTDMTQIAKAVCMSILQVRAAMILLLQKGLIQSEEIIDGEIHNGSRSL